MLEKKYLFFNYPVKMWIIAGIPIIFIVGSLLHFIYEWTGNIQIVGIIAPVNESVWEHLKMLFWPMLAWWILGYRFMINKNKVSTTKWFSSCAVAEIVGITVITAFYYTYTGAFGIELLLLDIFSLFLGITVAHLLALHVYKTLHVRKSYVYISIFLIILLAMLFILWTFMPPNLPIFNDM